ncbi:hypothetical protein NDU88_001009 [Pleurodeles waltl]|uniref:Uncharacterized protein n=1 Tax=Pleurodeles waltl TaxID=8319 RepID=A0AAV7S972_PLEWA|nr:hypothetical protein NDU88_001009 [Pleurodeles waltl]
MRLVCHNLCCAPQHLSRPSPLHGPCAASAPHHGTAAPPPIHRHGPLRPTTLLPPERTTHPQGQEPKLRSTRGDQHNEPDIAPSSPATRATFIRIIRDLGAER